MKYYFSFILKGKTVEKEVLPVHVRDIHTNETVMLNTFFPEEIDGKRFMLVTEIVNEKGKRIYKLTDNYKTTFKREEKEDD